MLKVGNKIVLQIILTSLPHWRVIPNHQFRTYYLVLFIQARLLLLWCYLPWTRCWRWCESTIKLNLCCLKLLYFQLLYSNLFILWTDGTLLRWIKKLSRFFWSYKETELQAVHISTLSDQKYPMTKMQKIHNLPSLSPSTPFSALYVMTLYSST